MGPTVTQLAVMLRRDIGQCYYFWWFTKLTHPAEIVEIHSAGESPVDMAAVGRWRKGADEEREGDSQGQRKPWECWVIIELALSSSSLTDATGGSGATAYEYVFAPASCLGIGDRRLCPPQCGRCPVDAAVGS